MAKVFIGYPSAPENRNADSHNSVLAMGADQAAAIAAAKAQKLTGETSDANLDAWTWYEVAGTGTLPGGRTVVWGLGLQNVGAGRAI